MDYFILKKQHVMLTIMPIIMFIITNRMELEQQMAKDTTTKINKKNNWISVGASKKKMK
jgi:hypothetical protein